MSGPMILPRFGLLSALLVFSPLTGYTQQLRVSPHENIEIACDDCHNPEGWVVDAGSVRFDHSQTAFPLDGRHRSANCRDCHTALSFKEARAECSSCHQDPHSAQFSETCAACHSPDKWENRGEMAQRHNLGRFPLLGAHKGVDCQSCHVGGVFAGTQRECASCHLDHFKQTDNPAHQQAGFPVNCTICHDRAGRGWSGAAFSHSGSFPLTLGHKGVECASCHSTGYANVSVACISCHLPDYRAVTDPNHTASSFPQTCENCHSPAGWTPARFDHALARFQLTGRHVAVSCSDCHSGGRYTGTPRDCYGCHASDYQAALDPNHIAAAYSQTCEICHTPNGWTPASIDHAATDFPLLGAHQAVDCASCHTRGYNNTSTLCIDCHLSDYQGVADPNHTGGGYDRECLACHRMEGWRPATIDHAMTQFPLTGAHSTTDCAECHSQGYNGTARDCYSCHRADYKQVQQPNHVAAQFNRDCAGCHTTEVWKPATFDHAATDFPLTGAHRTADCGACHINGQFDGTSRECYPCHRSDYEEVQQPNHVAAQFNRDCTGCHTTEVWKPATFNHAETDFPLTGAHRTADCGACHINGQFDGTSRECYPCHRADYEQVQQPNHATAQFNRDCAGCHTTEVWKPATFDHAATDFPLTGAHRAADCAACHTDGLFNGLPQDCWSCHRPNYERAGDPNHLNRNYSQSCELCHSTAGWAPAKIDHDRATNFPLLGAHRFARCNDCHSFGRYTGTSTACFACHAGEYADVENPDHAAGGFDRNCGVCHAPSGWKPASFDHSLADFQLTGAHRTASCLSCHIGGRFTGTASECWSCHQDDFEGALDPNHSAARLDHECSTCHTTDGWTPSTFDHSRTDYPLEGAHRSVQCASCHTDGRFDGLPTDCWSCHQQDFGEVQEPNHAGGQFPHDCLVCHSMEGWTPAQFNHDNSDFPLRGAHRAVECASCHSGGRYDGLATDCWSCHQDEYEGVQDPNHSAGNYNRDCVICHSLDGWSPAQIDHDQTDFPLTGAHRQVNCASCHINGRFAGTPRDCYPCHTNDFNGVGNPNHRNAGFPRDCEICHTTNNWDSPFVQNHDQQWFPIYSGAHRGEWRTCAECHTVAGNFQRFSCIDCHEHNNRREVDNDHDEVRDYQYNSEACYRCHPRGRHEDIGRPAPRRIDR